MLEKKTVCWVKKIKYLLFSFLPFPPINNELSPYKTYQYIGLGMWDFLWSVYRRLILSLLSCCADLGQYFSAELFWDFQLPVGEENKNNVKILFQTVANPPTAATYSTNRATHNVITEQFTKQQCTPLRGTAQLCQLCI